MKTMLTAGGEIGIPPGIRRHDHLKAGDQFDLDRLAAGHYVLTKLQKQPAGFSLGTAEDGLPVIRSDGGMITSKLVKEIESQTV